MNIKQLEYFISVAKHLNFTKAAKEHYLSQTAISQQIKNLEEIVGFKLFERNKKSVALTSSGLVFYNDAIEILDNLKLSIKKASLAAEEYVGTLSIGFVEGHEKILLPKLISKFNKSYPKINLSIIRGTVDELYKKLQDNLVDLVFSFKFDHDNYGNIQSKVIREYPLAAVLYPDHPLASRKGISRKELKDEDFIFINHSKTPFFFNSLLEEFKEYNYSPKIRYEVDSLETALLLVEAKLGISILPNHGYNSKENKLIFVNLQGETVESTISWNDTNITQAVQLFLWIFLDPSGPENFQVQGII